MALKKISGNPKQQAAETTAAKEENELFQLFPEAGKILLTGGGKSFIERIGVDAVRNAVHSVMIGENLRTQTEPLSRRRIAQVSGALIAMLTKGYLKIGELNSKMSNLSIDQLNTARRNDNAAIWPAQWSVGLTGKSVQNVLRSKKEAFLEYVSEFEKAIKDSANHCKTQIGDYKMQLGFVENGKGEYATLDWEGMIRLTTLIGAQTLTIRGSDKSMYGKLF